MAINSQPGNYTIAPSDIDGLVRMTSSTPVNLVIPPNAFPVDIKVNATQAGDGTVSIVVGVGVQANSEGDCLKSRAKRCVFTMWQTSLNNWLIFGGLKL